MSQISLNYSATIFDSIGALTSFNLSETIWRAYSKFAIAKITDGTLKIRGSLYYVKELTPKEAQAELDSLEPIIPVLNSLRLAIEKVDDKEFKKFRECTVDFFDTIDHLYDSLQDIADVNFSYKASLGVLSNDWDSDEDQHWDNY